MAGSAERIAKGASPGDDSPPAGSPALLPDDAAECFRAAFEDAAIGMSITGTDRRFIYVNRTLARMLGRTQEELRGVPYEAVTHPDDIGRNVGLTEAALDEGPRATYRLEKRYVHRDGHVVWVDLSARVIVDAQGAPRYFVTHMTDQSARRADAEALLHRDRILEAANRTAEILLERSVEQGLPEAVALLGRASGASRAYFFEHFRSPDGEPMTRERCEWNAPGVVPQSSNPRYRGYRLADVGLGRWLEVHGRGEVIAAHVRDLPAAERPVFGPQDVLSVIAVPVMVDGEAIGFLGFDACAEERTFLAAEIDALRLAARLLGAAVRRERTEAALAESRRLYEQAQRMEVLGRLAGGVAHDFNNMLTVIGSYGDLLAESVSPDDRTLVEEIRQATDRATTLTRQLLAASRPHAPHETGLDLNQAVEELRWTIGRVAGEGVTIETDLSRTPVPVEASVPALQQMLLNLLLRARDAMHGSGRVRISTCVHDLPAGRSAGVLPGRYGCLVVAHDRVAGLPPGPPPALVPAAGAGPRDDVALTIVRRLAAAAGGCVEHQARPAQGTSVRVLLRLSPRPQAAGPSAEA